MTGLQKFIMELQKVAETGESAWNSTYDFARGIGIKQERERIIKLLETRNRNKTHSEGRYCGLCEAIYLIKGDQK